MTPVIRTLAEVSALTAALLVPALVLLFVFSTALWVYEDAKLQYERGTPVVLSVSTFEVATPKAWFLGCLLAWLVFFPLYLKGRKS